MMDRGYSEELSCEKSYPMIYSLLHLTCFLRSWGILVALLFSLENLLQNGVFTSESGTRNSYFGQSIWICCLQICILWRLLWRIARRCRLRDHTYQPQKVLSWKVTCIRSCMLFCVYISTSEDVWVGWVSLRPFWNVWSCFEGFWTIVFACDRLKSRCSSVGH